MFEIKGKHNTAKIFTDNIDSSAIDQIRELCDQEFVRGSRIRIMPDAHAGAGCTIGTTMTVRDKIVPNLVGVDIGCGMETVLLHESEIDLEKLDRVIYNKIPAGFDVRSTKHPYTEKVELEKLACRKHVDMGRAMLSIGTLGGGNHFIEVGRDDSGDLYLVVHSGSRHLGKQVAEYYQNRAYRELREAGRAAGINRQLAYLHGNSFREYLDDMKIVQRYATMNRKAIVDEILTHMKLNAVDRFTTIHNYIDLDSMILRKGAISARKDERVLIPINMRDGSLICIGKGNEDWNYSAPHGAGRIMSRREEKKSISLKEYENTMKGIYSTTVNRSTLDECALAYKPMDEIISNIRDTVEVIEIIKPIYNFKAAE